MKMPYWATLVKTGRKIKVSCAVIGAYKSGVKDKANADKIINKIKASCKICSETQVDSSLVMHTRHGFKDTIHRKTKSGCVASNLFVWF